MTRPDPGRTRTARIARRFALLSVALISWSSVAATTAPAVTRQPAATVLPTTMCRDYVLIPLAVGGDEDRSLLFVFDTGAGHTIVDPDSIERVAAKRVRAGRWTRFQKMTAGRATIRRLRARVQELDHIGRALGVDIDGILGFPTFEDVLLTLDYARSELRLTEGSLPAPDGVEVFALDRRERRRPWFSIQVGTSRRSVLIDSGSGTGLTLRDSERMRWITPPRLAGASMRINHLELEHAGRLATDVIFAGARIAHPVVDLSEDTEFIGTPVLRHFELTFDQRTRRVRLHRTDDTAIQLGPRHGTGALFEATMAGLEVVRVIEDSPAEIAGLKAGDIVTAVNGQAVAKRSCRTRSPLTDPDSQEVVLTLAHDDEARDVTVSIIELVP